MTGVSIGGVKILRGKELNGNSSSFMASKPKRPRSGGSPGYSPDNAATVGHG